MVADFFTLCGCNVLFVGANTPAEDIVNAIKYSAPEFVAVSITSYYNLVAAKSVIEKITGLRPGLSFKVILGGQACKRNTTVCRQMGADLILDSFDDIRRLTGGEVDAGT
jgi:MerR family transcriptional regulator, light-induced transcriptional regulator